MKILLTILFTKFCSNNKKKRILQLTRHMKKVVLVIPLVAEDYNMLKLAVLYYFLAFLVKFAIRTGNFSAQGAQ